ncbi:MAG: Holliday junction resolvase RuvX [Gammaproteobacteria bacterium]
MTAAVQTLLGFDVGEKRIGVAVGQTLTATASPLITIAVTNNRPDWAGITQLIEDWQPQALVVGIPLTMTDARQPMTERAEKFMRQLQGRYKLPTYGIDERLSSYEAQTRLRSSYDVDPAAAQVILETWLADNVPGR